MALETKQQITLTGYSKIDGQVAVNLNATIPSDTGVGSINQYIQNAELYEGNKLQIRKDVRAFQDQVYKIEDDFMTAVENIPVDDETTLEEPIE